MRREYTEEQIHTGEWVRTLSEHSARGWHAFYHTGEWKRKRAEILKRDHQACAECAKHGVYTKADTVHHIVHLRDAPELALTDSNLESLCSACHDKEHPERQYKRRDEPITHERW